MNFPNWPKITGITETWFTAKNVEAIPPVSGSYLLILRLQAPLSVRIPGSEMLLPPGWYAYCGSANGPGGIRSRLGRHFRTDKKVHWHIDQLTTKACDLTAAALPATSECEVVSHLEKRDGFSFPLPGFGSSDCKNCISHLMQYKT